MVLCSTALMGLSVGTGNAESMTRTPGRLDELFLDGNEMENCPRRPVNLNVARRGHKWGIRRQGRPDRPASTPISDDQSDDASFSPEIHSPRSANDR